MSRVMWCTGCGQDKPVDGFVLRELSDRPEQPMPSLRAGQEPGKTGRQERRKAPGSHRDRDPGSKAPGGLRGRGEYCRSPGRWP